MVKVGFEFCQGKAVGPSQNPPPYAPAVWTQKPGSFPPKSGNKPVIVKVLLSRVQTAGLVLICLMWSVVQLATNSLSVVGETVAVSLPTISTPGPMKCVPIVGKLS